jgi:asparagine synthase (glutamine-hydrolysing)
MCGIGGVISSDPHLVKKSTAAMMRSLHHRGPDDSGVQLVPMGRAADGPWAGFGFRRLSILDLSQAAHQPMVCPETGDVLIFNGEIYNFCALRIELAAAGARFRSSGDTEVLLRALTEWGEEALAKIQGMYALAFYQARSRRILLARDPLGMKPLYFARTPEAFVFASEIRAVRASRLVADDLDVGGVAGMLAYGAVPSPRTVFQAIRSFPAGACQWVDADVLSGVGPAPVRRFWNFASRPRPMQDRATIVAEVRQRLRDSVRRHVMADVPVGVFLSGGIDSAIVAAIARDYTPRLAAFTVGYESRHGDDEVATACATAESLGIRSITLAVGGRKLLPQWQDWIASMDSPSIDGFNTYIASQMLALGGAVVGLSGLGADELFGGYPSFSRGRRLSRLLRGLRVLSPGLRAGAVAALGRLVGRDSLSSKFADLLAGDPSPAGVTRSLRRVIGNRLLRSMRLLDDRLGLGSDYLDPPDPNLETTFDGDAFNTVSRVEMTGYMADMLLRDTDANSMRHSREVRLPFLDLPLVDYVSSLPGSVKLGGDGGTKSLLREAMWDVRLDAAARRPKRGFTLPIGAWMRCELRDHCAAAVETVADLPFLEGDAVRGLWRAFLRDDRSVHWSRPFAVVSLGSYLMQPHDGGVRPLAPALDRGEIREFADSAV